MKFLITGSCGFIFSNVVLYMLQHTDHEIVSVDKLTYAGSLANIAYNREINNKRHTFYLGDVSDYHFVKNVFKIERPDIVIHGAAESSVDNSINNASDFVQTNVSGTYNMLEAALKVHTPQKFINISTDECYGSLDQGFSKESDPMEPRNPYSSTKAAADLMGNAYHITHGLPIITTRCSNNFGPRQHLEKFIPKVITNILDNQPIPLYGDGQNIREWTYVKDNFNAIMCLIENGRPGEAYNISSGTALTNTQVLENIFEIMGAGANLVKHVPDRMGHDRRYALDCSKIKQLGWAPKYTFADALDYTITWYKKNISWFRR